MVMSVEAYFGEQGGAEGVKIEEQLIITESEPETITECVDHDSRLLR
jgi:Xaa-Pro aminopeptidase